MNLTCENGYRLKPMQARDLTPAYIAWFNAPYVKAGLNLPDQALTRADHAQHIAQCAVIGHRPYLLFDAKRQLLNYYIRFTTTTLSGVGELDMAADITDPKRYDRLRAAGRAVTAHAFDTLNVHKMKLRINRSNVAARFYADQSLFRLEAILRHEVINSHGRAEDVLVYGLLRDEFYQSPLSEKAS